MLPSKWWQRPYYQLTQEIEFNGHYLPKGFISDGATVPRIFWPIFPPIGRYLKATLVHDYYLQQGTSRKMADKYFKECLFALGISKWRVNAMFFAVRSYGVLKMRLKLA